MNYFLWCWNTVTDKGSHTHVQHERWEVLFIEHPPYRRTYGRLYFVSVNGTIYIWDSILNRKSSISHNGAALNMESREMEGTFCCSSSVMWVTFWKAAVSHSAVLKYTCILIYRTDNHGGRKTAFLQIMENINLWHNIYSCDWYKRVNKVQIKSNDYDSFHRFFSFMWQDKLRFHVCLKLAIQPQRKGKRQADRWRQG